MSLFNKKMSMLLCATALMFPAKTMQATSYSLPASTNASTSAVVVPTVDNTKGLFVILTDGNAMTQMMAFALATQTLEQGKSLQILLCGEAGKLAVKNSAQTMLKPVNKSPQMMLASLMSRGVKVEVCPLFLPNTNMTEANLITGVTVAKPPVIAQQMRADGIKLFTF